MGKKTSEAHRTDNRVYIGTAAHGKRSRYRYYTCYLRVRYDPRQCTAARLPADAVDRALLECIIATYSDTTWMANSLEQARVRDADAHPRTRDELGAVRAEMRKTDEAVDPYFSAFEAGTLSEQMCSRRVEGLTMKLAELRNREAELLAQLEIPEGPQLGASELAEMADLVRETLQRATPKQQKAIIRNLVAEIRPESPDALYPLLRLPQAGVRVLSRIVAQRMVDPAVQYSNTEHLIGVGRVSPWGCRERSRCRLASPRPTTGSAC